MIRSTKNEGISSLSKQNIIPNVGNVNPGMKSEAFEAVEITATGEMVEHRDAFGDHLDTESWYPSGEFNGTFE